MMTARPAVLIVFVRLTVSNCTLAGGFMGSIRVFIESTPIQTAKFWYSLKAQEKNLDPGL